LLLGLLLLSDLAVACGPRPGGAPPLAAEPPTPPGSASALELRALPALELGGATPASLLDAAVPGGTFDISSGDGPTRTVRTCGEASEVLSTPRLNVEGTSDDYQSFMYQATRCKALDLLVQARPARQSRVRALLDRAIGEWAPPQLAMLADSAAVAQAKRAANACEVWSRYDIALREIKRDDRSVTFQSELYEARVSLLALADFDGDQWEDLLLRREAWASEGSYGEAILLLLTEREGDRCVRVVQQFPELP
jgi:hypothetical protein